MKSTMRFRLKIAFVFHLLASLLIIFFGLMYILRSQFMPYHAIAVGKNWAEVDPTFQILILALMRVAGGGFLAGAFAIIIILLKPLKQDFQWAYWAIPIIGMPVSLSSLYATIYVAKNTPASTPWMAAALGGLFIMVGFILSVIPDAKAKTDEMIEKV